MGFVYRQSLYREWRAADTKSVSQSTVAASHDNNPNSRFDCRLYEVVSSQHIGLVGRVEWNALFFSTRTKVGMVYGSGLCSEVLDSFHSLDCALTIFKTG